VEGTGHREHALEEALNPALPLFLLLGNDKVSGLPLPHTATMMSCATRGSKQQGQATAG
jgi:hypothetical protein